MLKEGLKNSNDFTKLQGLSFKSLRHHYSLIPLFAAMSFGMCLVVGMSTRMLTKASDISWLKEVKIAPNLGNRKYFMTIFSRNNPTMPTRINNTSF